MEKAFYINSGQVACIWNKVLWDLGVVYRTRHSQGKKCISRNIMQSDWKIMYQ